MTAILDINRLRSETPGCAVSAYFDHSGFSLPTDATLAAVADHLRREALYGGMVAAAGAAEQVQQVRNDAAKLLGGTPEEIAFMTSGSAAFGLVFAALPRLKAGDRILVGRQEWGGNLGTMYQAAGKVGASVEAIPCRDDGSVDPDALSRMIDDRVRLVELTWLPVNGGLINDAAAIGRVTRAAGVPYFIDAGQAIGQLPVDVVTLGCDVLKGACRKYLRGPRGTALLYVRKAFLASLEPAFFDVQSAPWVGGGPVPRQDARLFETIETSIALQLGLGAALRRAHALGIPAIRERIKKLADGLRARLREIRSVTVHDLGTEHSGLVSFTIEGLGAPEVRARLAREQITVGANGVAYTPLDMTARKLTEIVRASVTYINTEEEIERLAGAIAQIAQSAG